MVSKATIVLCNTLTRHTVATASTVPEYLVIRSNDQYPSLLLLSGTVPCPISCRCASSYNTTLNFYTLSLEPHFASEKRRHFGESTVNPESLFSTPVSVDFHLKLIQPLLHQNRVGIASRCCSTHSQSSTYSTLIQHIQHINAAQTSGRHGSTLPTTTAALHIYCHTDFCSETTCSLRRFKGRR